MKVKPSSLNFVYVDVTAQHVSDLLRDKLQTLGVELIDSKSRISGLEQSHNADRDALRGSNSKLSESCESFGFIDMKL